MKEAANGRPRCVRVSSASAKDANRGLVPNKAGNSRRMARTSSLPGRRPAFCRAGSRALGPPQATVSTGELCGIEGSIGVAWRLEGQKPRDKHSSRLASTSPNLRIIPPPFQL